MICVCMNCIHSPVQGDGQLQQPASGSTHSLQTVAQQHGVYMPQHTAVSHSGAAAVLMKDARHVVHNGTIHEHAHYAQQEHIAQQQHQIQQQHQQHALHSHAALNNAAQAGGLHHSSLQHQQQQQQQYHHSLQQQQQSLQQQQQRLLLLQTQAANREQLALSKLTVSPRSTSPILVPGSKEQMSWPLTSLNTMAVIAATVAVTPETPMSQRLDLAWGRVAAAVQAGSATGKQRVSVIRL
jgi:hypothetical protein